MTVCSGLMMPKSSAFLSPNLTCQLCHLLIGHISSPDPVVNVHLPLLGGDTSGLGVPDGVDTSGEVHLPGALQVAGHTDDGALGAVLGDQAGGDTPCMSACTKEHGPIFNLRGGENNNGTGILLNGSGNGGEGQSLGGLGGAGGEGTKLVE